MEIGWRSIIDLQISTRGRIVTAEEWYGWRARGMRTGEIASMLGISPSMAGVIGRRFREAGVPDPQYRKRRPGAPGELDASTDAGAYVLGVLWGTASLGSGGVFWVRHRDRWYPQVVKDWLGITAGIHQTSSKTGRQHRLKVSRAADVAALENIFARHGWSPRNAPRRPYPAGGVDDRGFIRAWAELHASYDTVAAGRRRVLLPRLRIYGNYELLDEINRVLAAACGAVLAWLYGGAELFNPRSKLLEGLPRAGGGM